MRILQAPPAARRRLARGALVVWLGLRIGAVGLVLAMSGKLSAIGATFSPPAQVALVLLATALAPLDLRLSRERVFLANLGVGPVEATVLAFLGVSGVEVALRALAVLLSL